MFFAVPFQVSVLLASMCFVFHAWTKFAFFSVVAVFTGLGLYFFWFKNLKSEEECAEDDARIAKRAETEG